MQKKEPRLRLRLLFSLYFYPLRLPPSALRVKTTIPSVTSERIRSLRATVFGTFTRLIRGANFPNSGF